MAVSYFKFGPMCTNYHLWTAGVLKRRFADGSSIDSGLWLHPCVN